MFLFVPYKSENEMIYINLAHVTMAQPRVAKVGVAGEKKGKTYTSFLLTSYVSSSPTLDTLLEWSKFMDEVAPFEAAWAPKRPG